MSCDEYCVVGQFDVLIITTYNYNNNKEKKKINIVIKKNAMDFNISIDWDGCSSIILSYHMYNSNDNHD